MVVKIDNVTLAPWVQERIKEEEFKVVAFNKFNELKSINARIYTEKEIKLDKFLGFKDIWMITKIDNRYLKMRGNITFNAMKGESQLFITNLIVLRNKVENGIAVEFIRGRSSNLEFISFMHEIQSNKDFILVFEDNSNILAAIELYKDITTQQDNISDFEVNISKFVPSYVYEVDKKTAKELEVDVVTMNNKVYVEKEHLPDLPDDSYNNNALLLLSAKIKKIPKKANMAIKAILKDEGNLYISEDPKDRNPKNSIKLMDFKILKGKEENKLSLVVKDIDLDSDMYLLFFDRLKYRKRNTMLSIVKDIKANRINNNNLFQVLFNNGDINKIENIENWPINASLAKKYSNKLFDRQKEAFNLSIDAFPITFIQGPPGTGKTHTITQICKYYNDLGKKVLISSQTNVAVENIMENLWEDDEFTSITAKADYTKSKYSENNMLVNAEIKISKLLDISSIDFSETNALSSVYHANIVGSTTTSSAINTKRWRDFYEKLDVVIVDEISKSSVPELIRFVVAGKKIIFVGDQNQLAPLDEIDGYDEIWDRYDSHEKQIIEEYINASIFEKQFELMKKNGRAITLNVNSRSVKYLSEVYEKFYDEGLRPRRNNEDSKIQYKEGQKPHYPFTFISMNGSREVKIQRGSRYNVLEASYIENLLEELLNNITNTKELSVAIISFYGAQVGKIRENVSIEKYKKHFKRIKLNTVDAFQGDQADIVIISTVREDKTLSLGFVDDFRRTNVAISRGRDLVFMLGNDFLLRSVNMKKDNKNHYFYDELFDDLNNKKDENYQKPIKRKGVN